MINDQFTNLSVSRQRKYQLRKRAEGKCITCGTRAVYKYEFCMECCNKRGLIGTRGYGTSVGENQFLNHFKVPTRQVLINGVIVDGVKGKTIYEYLGDYWHGNPEIYNASKFNSQAKKTYGQLYKETMTRLKSLNVAGYYVKYVWEKDWNQFYRVKTIPLKLTTLLP